MTLGRGGDLFRRKLEWLESSDRQNHTYYQQDDEDRPLESYGVDQGEEETLYAHILFQIRGIELESSIRESVIFLAESLDGSGAG